MGKSRMDIIERAGRTTPLGNGRTTPQGHGPNNLRTGLSSFPSSEAQGSNIGGIAREERGGKKAERTKGAGGQAEKGRADQEQGGGGKTCSRGENKKGRRG